jgi:hypothetical protein
MYQMTTWSNAFEPAGLVLGKRLLLSSYRVNMSRQRVVS